MVDTEKLILIGCLLQGALGREFAVWMPQSIEALSGSCVLIPCKFEIPPRYDEDLVAGAKGLWKKGGTGGTEVFDSSITETTPQRNIIKGTLIGNLLMKNCTTILDRFPSSYSDRYFFRLESKSPLLANFPTGVRINARGLPPKLNLTPEKVVLEGTSVNLSCSAAAPCPKLPPNLTWTPRLSDTVNQLKENEDHTKSVSSVLSFTASHLHHGQKITCRALYTLQQGGIQMTSEASLTLRILYPPKNTSVSVSPSGSVLEGSSVTLSCSSKANPPVQNYTWYKVNGTEINTVGTGENLTFNVTESNGSEQYYCEAQNQHGKEKSTPVELYVKYMPRISGSGSCSRTAAEISCSCESRGNPSPSMEWRVSGLQVINSTDRVIREEHLGNTSLRSSLTMRQSQGDTPTVLCISTNSLGSSSLQLHVLSPQQYSDLSSTGLLLIGVLIGALMASLLWGVAQYMKQKKLRMTKNCADDSHKVQTRDKKEEPTSPAEEHCERKPSRGPLSKSAEDIYANHLMVARKRGEEEEQTKSQSQAAEDTLHYASIKFNARKRGHEASAITSPIYDNMSCDLNRKNCAAHNTQ